MPKKGPKRARQHHVLPQFYLRAWADAQDAVAMLARDGKHVVTGTAALAVEKDFYTVTTPSGEKVSVVEEELLREWDCEHLSDEQMRELNPIVRNAIYEALVMLDRVGEGDPSVHEEIAWLVAMVPDYYWEAPRLPPDSSTCEASDRGDQ